MVGLVGQMYEEKQTELGLNTLKNRRIQIDLIHTFKILKGIVSGLNQTHGSILLKIMLPD